MIIMKMKNIVPGIITLISIFLTACTPQKATTSFQASTSKAEVLNIINKVNSYWQANNALQQRAFWDVAAYHTGNMEAYTITRNESYKKYSEDWATFNQWMGAKSNNKSEWQYNYG